MTYANNWYMDSPQQRYAQSYVEVASEMDINNGLFSFHISCLSTCIFRVINANIYLNKNKLLCICPLIIRKLNPII